MIPHSIYHQPLLNKPANRPNITINVVVVVVTFTASVLLLAALKFNTMQEALDVDSPPDWIQRIMEIPTANRSRLQMHTLTRRQSLAGSSGDFRLAQYVAEQFREFGVPRIDVHEYNVLLSSPISCSLSMTSSNGSLHQFTLEEPEIRSADAVDRSAINPYIAYSASKKVNSTVIYLNYGRKEDFEELDRSGVNLTGHIGIARYGKIFRGLKTMLAQEYGMIGLIIYSDPANDGDKRGDVYPDGKWRPPESIQGGSSMFISLFSGDPLTPGVGAIPSLDPSQKKYTPENSPVLPKIPVLAIGYGNAHEILKLMGGPKASEKWQGGLPLTYHIGPGPFVEMDVQMDQSLKSIFNVVGTFDGCVQPDRRVLIGNHRDAWVFGAVDPHSGTASLLESARAFAQIYKEGWRPKRTLQICSWDAEEFGLVGSSEFVEQFARLLQDQAVAYLNVDEGVSGGDFFRIMSSPSMSSIVQNVTKLIRFPNSDKSVYDLWMNNSNCTVDPVGSGSDYSGFIQYLGISSLDLRFSSKEGPYGVYHSKYDDAIWYERFADPDYATSITLTRLWTVLSMAFTDSGLVPLRITPYAMALKSYVEKLKRDIVDPASLKSVDDAVCQFLNAAKTIDLEADSLASTNDPKAVADLNDRLALVERKFLMNEALPGRQEMYYRHSIYAPGLYEGYGASVLPGLKYAVDSGNSTLFQQQSEILKDCIFNASSFLKGN